ncbi:hypothetical protein JCM15519_17110 [Fundidesulfovibrio butyratiphilus]
MSKMETVAEAIRGHRTLNLWYNGGMRTVEPHCCGYGTSGQGLLRCWHVSGHSQSGAGAGWHLFTVAEIRDCTIGEEFQGTRPHYNSAGDKAIPRVVAKL